VALILGHATPCTADAASVLGFSAGGHLAAWAATNFDKRAYDRIDATDDASCRPDFAVMIYPGGVVKRGTAELSPEIRVTAETRFLVFTTMAYGGRGISYFTYWGPEAYAGLYRDGKPSLMAKEVALLNAEMARFGSALMELDSTAVYHTAPLPYGTQAIPADAPVRFTGGGEFVLGLFGRKGQTTAFMVVNRSYKQDAEAAVKVEIPGGKLQKLDRRTGKWSDVPSLGADRELKIKLGQGDGRLFRAGK
jgi:hypothetical protein